MRYPYYILYSLLILSSCQVQERLSPDSVVEAAYPEEETSTPDDWIKRELTTPYGIEVRYKWSREAEVEGRYLYPPSPDKVLSILKAMKYLWIDTYAIAKPGSSPFLKGKAPLRITLYGGSNVDVNGIELPSDPTKAGIEMSLYDVNTFDPTDRNHLLQLMRNVYHQSTTRLLDIIPYDREGFMSHSLKEYNPDTYDQQDYLMRLTKPERYKIHPAALKRGFLSFYAVLSPEEDFAEMVSINLTHTPVEITEAIQRSAIPDSDSDPIIHQRNMDQARRAHAALTAKQAYVEEYFRSKLGISLKSMQLLSLTRLNTYRDQSRTSEQP